jgi:hypothetical protein
MNWYDDKVWLEKQGWVVNAPQYDKPHRYYTINLPTGPVTMFAQLTVNLLFINDNVIKQVNSKEELAKIMAVLMN